MARILIGNIKGPKGDKGATGAKGATGPAGPQGPLPPLINNALATQAGVAALDAVMGKTLGDQITQLNTDFDGLNNSAVTARQRSDRTANEMVGSNNRVEFYIIDGTWGTTTNKFPLNSAGVLQVMNLYGSHAIQVFYPLSNSKIYKRENNGLTSWTAWTEK